MSRSIVHAITLFCVEPRLWRFAALPLSQNNANKELPWHCQSLSIAIRVMMTRLPSFLPSPHPNSM
ncbi:hypothetical protein KOSB73_260187 [Klebsiella grimontii]|uniref:Uncharacterized protein n=1 Tax=Klebsiella grimontii TaxID=2058152 RepID=A0A285B3Q9_9ENTR|nr:hypothetical protein KOSB73_260187 [Klebsiella grimontii]